MKIVDFIFPDNTVPGYFKNALTGGFDDANTKFLNANEPAAKTLKWLNRFNPEPGSRKVVQSVTTGILELKKLNDGEYAGKPTEELVSDAVKGATEVAGVEIPDHVKEMITSDAAKKAMRHIDTKRGAVDPAILKQAAQNEVAETVAKRNPVAVKETLADLKNFETVLSYDKNTPVDETALQTPSSGAPARAKPAVTELS